MSSTPTLHMLRFSDDGIPFWGCESGLMYRHNTRICIDGLTPRTAAHNRHIAAATKNLDHVTCGNCLRSGTYKAALITRKLSIS